ncbi:cell surface glycoprotein CD200 receptor 1-A-like [Mantella aurantiaca]
MKDGQIFTLFFTEVKAVDVGSVTTLTCAHEKGKEFLMSTWKVRHLNKSCHVSFSIDEKGENRTFNGCTDRIHQEVGTTRITLTLQNITVSDEGNYTCEVVNERGTLPSTITLKVLATPFVLIRFTSSRSVECRAIGGHPAAAVWWNSTLPSEVSDTTSMENNQTTTVISTFTPKEDNETQATCVIHHPAFPHPVVLNITIPAAEIRTILWVSVTAAVVIVVAVTILLLWQRSSLRNFFANKKRHISELQENPTVMVEDVEPYASFTQKVNTIYNSTNELSEAKEKNLTIDYGFKKIYF